MDRIALAAALVLALAACTREAPPQSTSSPPREAAAPRSYAVETWTLPATSGAQPDLVAAPDGTLLLSWIEQRDGRHALRFARHADARWSTPRTIAEGDDWFVNWADTPHIAATADGALWAHWLRKSAAATYAYDVVLSRSGDGGATWSTPVRVNDDGTPTEHGFVSLWPATRDAVGIAWLDGRDTGGGEGGHGGGMMTLRAARFDASLARADEMGVDASVCDCCQTDIAMTARGALLVYRDRTAQEIRDIATTRLTAQGWTPPRVAHADGWRMPACPVNGPSVAARGDDVHVAWYTAAQGLPEIRHARSTDAGDGFGDALVVDRGEAVLGRVSVAMDGGDALIAWLREDASEQSLWLARVAGDPARVIQRMRVAGLSGRGRGTGLPQLVAARGRLHLVWTDIVDGRPQLHGAMLAPR